MCNHLNKAMNRAKLSKLVSEKMEELGMTQDQFAEYFSKVAGNTVTYGFVQSLANPRKTSIPEYQNMRGIARLYGVTMDELDEYLENDEIVDIKEVNSIYDRFKKKIEVDPEAACHALESSFGGEALLRISQRLIDAALKDIKDKMETAEKVSAMFKTLGLSQK
jgi:transcriptional regulator with XRE-family HTH domain